VTTFDPNGIPVYALTCWSDDNFVYVALPVVDGPHYIQKFSITDAGFQKALGVLRDNHRKAAPKVIGTTIAEHPKLRRMAPSQVTEEQKANAREVLRRLGIGRR
jgi:hypothetical protein